METIINHPAVQVKSAKTTLIQKPDSNILLGYLLLFVSFILFVLVDGGLESKSDLFTVFILHYFLAIVYTVILIFNKAFGIRKSWHKQNISKTIILLNLFLVSAYALNRELPVFEKSTDWLCAYLITTSIIGLSYHYFLVLPHWVNRIQHFILGSTFVLYIYLTLYVAHYYPLGTIGLIFFGIGGHIFVPLTLLAASIFIMRYSFKEKTISYAWMICGFLFTILYGIGFIGEWSKRVEKIERIANQSVMYNDTELPVWVKVGQSMPNDWITQRILKSELVYTTKNKFDNWQLIPENVSWDEVRKHDPFVFLSTWKSTCTLIAEDRVKILQVIADGRHKSNERLWSGDNLTTSYVISDVDIYPDLRLAYTEKYLNVRNNAKNNRWWGNTEEAIYTFQLPEGSVITSLSLWINGKEEKAILTSKQKATHAYKTIVGIERRDPSVIHWQEGNTVTVRVFPCTKEEERKFKVGITSPLIQRNGEILYKSITFRGPDPDHAKETIRVRILGAQKEIKMPGFTKDKNGAYILENEYDPEFQFSLKTVPIKTDNRFTFRDHSFSLSDYKPVYQKAVLDLIYLDINNSWTSTEINELMELTKNKEVLVYKDEDFIKLTEENWDLAHELKDRNFSIFPFHQLKDKDHALVVTKGKPLSPHLSDFKDSKFAIGIGDFFASGKKVYVYNLEGETSTYISSLRELRALEFAQGNIEQLKHWLSENKYSSMIEDDETILLHDAHLVISKKKISDNALPNNAPDHLARLFAYNNILRKVGANYFKDDYIDELLIAEATAAYVVSPVSSLIVLETQEDYKRFDINDTSESLKNASKHSSGAVPEPHEWALIILFTLFVIFITVKNRKLKAA